jgi:hypothetical protein
MVGAVMQMEYPTSSDSGLLKRSMKSDLSEVLGRMAGVLDRMVDFGTHLVIWCGPESAGKSISLAPPLMLLNHAVEEADAISILLRRGSVDPCGPLLRSQIEATISAFYILKEDTERRGLAYRYGILQNKLINLERLDPTTNKGKEALRRLSSDKTLGNLPPLDPVRIAAEKAHVKANLDNPRFSEVKAAWTAFEAKCKRAPAWHALFKGPSNVADLAERVGCAGWYDFYRDFSDETHSTSAMKSLRKDSKTSKALLRPLRYPEVAPRCFGLCGAVLMHFYRTMIDRFCPAQKPALDRWYKERISDDFMELIDVRMKS